MNNELECTKNLLLFSPKSHVSFQVCIHMNALKCNCLPFSFLIPIICIWDVSKAENSLFAIFYYDGNHFEILSLIFNIKEIFLSKAKYLTLHRHVLLQ